MLCRPNSAVGNDEGMDDASGVAQRLLDRVMDHPGRLGITRVGDITSLDTIGVPVWFACRPNSRSLSVTQGKGLTKAQALISSIMEAAEQYYAERDALGRAAIAGSLNDLRASGRPLVPLGRLTDCLFAHFDPARNRRWLAGENLFSGRPAYAPLDIVAMDYRTASPYDRKACRMTSVGLGAGTSRAQAVLHALLEVVENGATALIEKLGLLPELQRELAIAPGENADLDALNRKLKDASVAARLFAVNHSLDIPVIGALVEGPRSAESGRSIGVFSGYSCHPDPYRAAVAALLEAIQSRLTDIAGARDDILPGDYARGGNLRQRFDKDSPSVGRAFGAATCTSPSDAAAVLDWVKALLLEAGIEDIFLFELGGPEIGAHVVKVLAADFDNASDDPVTDIGFHSLETLLNRSRDPS